MLWLVLSLAYPVALGPFLCVVKSGLMKEDPRFEGDKIIYRS
jgi:hypothetical protein